MGLTLFFAIPLTSPSPFPPTHIVCFLASIKSVVCLWFPFYEPGIHIGCELVQLLDGEAKEMREAQSKLASASQHAGDKRALDKLERLLKRARKRFEGRKQQLRKQIVRMVGILVGDFGVLGLPHLNGQGLRSSSKWLSRASDLVAWGLLEKAILAQAARRGIVVKTICEWGEHWRGVWGWGFIFFLHTHRLLIIVLLLLQFVAL